MRITVGMTLLWVGYAAGLYGYALLHGYNVTFPQLVNPKQVWLTDGSNFAAELKTLPKGTTYQQWPPSDTLPTVVIPSGLKPISSSAKAVG